MDMPSPETASETQARLIAWLLNEGRLIRPASALVRAFGHQIAAAGIPVWRLTLNLPQLNPQLASVTHIWFSDLDRVEENRIPRQQLNTLAYIHSPVSMAHRSGETVRRRLVGPDADLDFPVLEELRDQGGTDYLLLSGQLASARRAVFGLTSRAPEGFQDSQLAILEALVPAVTSIIEAIGAEHTTEALLQAYVGQEATRRILKGQITRGTGRTIEAVILFCDLRGFTRLSETLTRAALMDLLEDYFSVLVGRVHRAGGEVLKFMGDGLLAIFRYGGEEDRAAAAARALIAALETVAEFEALNPHRREASRPEIRCGIALHLGQVLFGNIGGEGRLDFTVIGPAVNRAARIEMQCVTTNETILTSASFAAAAPIALRSLGRFALRGLDTEEELFAPAVQTQDLSPAD